ncbi:MAG: helix-turn-helix transcriptional regulator [Paludibacterium sp.]|uniref:AraC family transcriptional regulator n=1 Tax=Paludibacterium sp. TaxID=1917523 RepID=UPI0025D8B566|nr:AraC family transcriptional regulator [Paludibacterium sp.]MBV8049223.1 helix-turn-helix transcriptional regulator [Paludibacterium sp.]MBV8646612.1 helix-turn-helix transcriptional regulator [Paludibacterium sp.]
METPLYRPQPASPVYEVLSHSRADLEREAQLGDGLRAALWLRETLEDTLYDRPAHHTLSLYLEDGYDVFLDGQPHRRGGPGKLCLLPAEHESYWRINGRIRFVHFYFTQEQFGAQAVRMLDAEPRTVALRQDIYLEDRRLAALARQLAAESWQDSESRLNANALGHEMLAYLLLNYSDRRRDLRPRGGLAPAQRRRVLDLIDARLGQELTVGELARELALSEYHFARMFRESVGEAPHRWIMRRRLARARRLLAHGDLPLDVVANQAGFSHASHLTRHFRTALGATPGTYRLWAQGRR